MERRDKKAKSGKEESRRVDRISSLPDDILVSKILRHLTLTDAVRTSTLSRRWRPLFHRIPRLVFNFYNPSYGAAVKDCDEWWESVKNVVSSRRKMTTETHAISDVDISAARINHAKADEVLDLLFQSPGIQNFHLLGRKPTGYLIPCVVCNCVSLVDLRLHNCALRLPQDFVGLPCLKTLFLCNVSVSIIDLDTIVSNCQDLENLEFYVAPSESWKGGTLNVRSNKLMYIGFYRNSLDWDISLKSVGPSLKRLSMRLYTCHYENPEPMYPTFSEEKLKFFQILMESRSLECLTLQIGRFYNEVMPKRLPREMLLVNLMKLDLSIQMPALLFHIFVAFLLHSSPNLEKLFITFCYLYTNVPPTRSWEDQHPITCVTHTLKLVTLRCYHGSRHCLDLTKFLLENAKALVKLMIRYQAFSDENDMNFEMLHALEKSHTTLEVKKIVP